MTGYTSDQPRGELAAGGRTSVLQATKAAACARESLGFPGPPRIVAVTPCLARHRANPGTGTRSMAYTSDRVGAVAPWLLMTTEYVPAPQ